MRVSRGFVIYIPRSLWFLSLTQPLAHLELFSLSIDSMLEVIGRGGSGEGLVTDSFKGERRRNQCDTQCI